MDKSLELAQSVILDPAGIDQSHLEKTLNTILGHQVDDADLYFQSTHYESWVLEDGIVKDGSFNIERGVGVRAIAGEKTGFAYSDDIVIPALDEAARAARSIAVHGDSGVVEIAGCKDTQSLYGQEDPLKSLSVDDKIDLLSSINQYIREQDSRIQEVILSLSGQHETILIMSSDGKLVADIRPLVRFDVNVIVADGSRRERAYAGGGGRFGYDQLLQNDRTFDFAKEALRQALVNLDAVNAPAGTMPVVLGSGWPGVLLHEAIGHGLEGDFNRKGTSAFSGRLGERVASAECTVVDDGTISGRRGSLNVDDEGTETECTVLIEEGILVNYMQDKLNARLMGMKPTGNGRRESYAHMPLPRMTNTYMLAGKHEPEEIIASVDKGLYAVNFGGGQVDITSGKFVFSANEAYLIENGKITSPVKGATLIGHGPDVLTRVSMVGNNMALDSGLGVCGKDGQSVPVGVGQPTLKVDALTVGGVSE